MISPYRERVIRDSYGGIAGMVALLDEGLYKARPLKLGVKPRHFGTYDDAKRWILELCPSGALPLEVA